MELGLLPELLFLLQDLLLLAVQLRLQVPLVQDSKGECRERPLLRLYGLLVLDGVPM